MPNNKQPIDLVVLKGNKHLTKDEIEKRKNEEIKADADSIVAPSYLHKKQKEKFDWYVTELSKCNIIANLDIEVLARQVMSEFQFEKVAKKLNSINVDNPEYEKLLVLYDKLSKLCRQGANDLGLNIISRCKITVPKPDEKPKNKFDKFNKGNGDTADEQCSSR